MTTQTTTDLLDDARDLVNHSDLDETGIRTLNRKARAAGDSDQERLCDEALSLSDHLAWLEADEAGVEDAPGPQTDHVAGLRTAMTAWRACEEAVRAAEAMDDTNNTAPTADLTNIRAANFRLSQDRCFTGDVQGHSALVAAEEVVALIPHGAGFSARVRVTIEAVGFEVGDDQIGSMGRSSTVRLYRAVPDTNTSDSLATGPRTGTIRRQFQTGDYYRVPVRQTAPDAPVEVCDPYTLARIEGSWLPLDEEETVAVQWAE